jgi:hypothetical protein
VSPTAAAGGLEGIRRREVPRQQGSNQIIPHNGAGFLLKIRSGPSGALWEYIGHRTLLHMARKLDRHVSFRLADPLHAELAADAERLGVTLAEATRRVVVDAMARRVVDRERAAPAHAETMQ